MISKVMYVGFAVAGFLLAGYCVFSITWSPLWLFSKYRSMRQLIIAQAKHETANFTSSLYWRAWNCFGMRIATVRKQTRIGETNGYARYWSPYQSLRDLFLWFDFHNLNPSTITNARHYAMYLKSKGYYTDTATNYARGLEYFMS